MSSRLLHALATMTCAPGYVLVDNVCNKSGLPVVNASSDQLQQILRLAFGIIAAIAILFVIIGGLRYVISEGDPEATAKARGTIIYALVGLVIAVTAEFLVSFVLNRL